MTTWFPRLIARLPASVHAKLLTEITIVPGGHVSDHNHLGPGIR